MVGFLAMGIMISFSFRFLSLLILAINSDELEASLALEDFSGDASSSFAMMDVGIGLLLLKVSGTL
jgi:hypothetical protein